jgi:signal transduction histidine kinase
MAMRPLDRLPTIRAKLGSVIVFAVAVTILIMYVAVGFALRQSERDRELRQLVGQAQVVAALSFNPAGAPARSLKRTIEQLPNPVVVVDQSGKSLAGKLEVPSTVHRALNGEVDTGTHGRTEYLGVPVLRNGAVVGAVYLSHQLEGGGPVGAIAETAHFVRSVWWQFLLAGAIAAFIALFLARILARGMTQPLRDMAQAARRMSKGDYTTSVAVRSRDEVGQLADAFNRMAGEMDSVERLRRDLVANVSHELKTPISALRAHLENLLDGVEEPNPAVIQVMLQQSERLSRLVDELLDLSRLEAGDVPLEIEPVPLGLLVERVIKEVEVARPDRARALAMRNEVPPDLPPVEADRERVHQVLFNLLENAVRFTPPGGEVTVQAVRENGAYTVSVQDTGPGIPKEHIPLVFERFYRVDTSRSREDGGTGLGLAIARSVVEAHGGRIWAESTDAIGARFTFVLPASRGEDAEVNGGGKERSPGAKGKAPSKEENV